MSRIEDLPKKPIDALEVLIPELVTEIGGIDIKLFALRGDGSDRFTRIFVAQRKCLAAASRLTDSDLRELIQSNLQITETTTSRQLSNKAVSTMSALMVTRMDEHFIGEGEIELFDVVPLEFDEREELRELLRTARNIAQESKVLTPKHQRNILYWLSKIENELLKERVGFAAFLAGTEQVSKAVKQFGEDLQPLADAVSKMRTKTEQKVEGQIQIAAEEKPKQIEDQTKG